MSPARVDLYLGYAAQVLNWAVKQYYTEKNPFKSLQYGKKKRKRADKQRDAFTKEDLKAMFVDSRYFGKDKWGKAVHPHFFWIALLGLYRFVFFSHNFNLANVTLSPSFVSLYLKHSYIVFGCKVIP